MTLMTAKEALGSEIKERRIAAGYSRRRFSLVFGMSRQRVMDIERGNCNPTIDTLQEFADALEVDIFELFKCASSRLEGK